MTNLLHAFNFNIIGEGILSVLKSVHLYVIAKTNLKDYIQEELYEFFSF